MGNKPTVEILDRVGFKEGSAISWERSFDHGRTWHEVEHCYKFIPFTRIQMRSRRVATERLEPDPQRATQEVSQ